MRVGAKVFYGIFTYLLISEIVYIFAVNFVKDDGYRHGPEWAGMVAMALAALLALMLAVYIQFTDARSDVLPEDWEEAETEDSAGILGFFSPGSIWPFMMTMAIAVLGLGIIFMYYWMIVLGAIMLVWSTAKLSLQYGLPKEKH